jgi:signal peptidase I
MANATAEARKTKKQPALEGNVKETLESILIAFVLAFVFRAFVVEAFVIPTGSMGPTLMGAHVRVTCPDCGYHFERNFSSSNGDDTDIPPYANFGQGNTVTCPNCGYRIPFSGSQPVFFGDRILVLKYRYLFNQPSPWDVVVFKSPYEKKRDADDPKYADNYIKRLVGLPGESVIILDGDVYIGAHGQDPRQFKIRRKSPHAQSSLWRDVYDNDYLSIGLPERVTNGSMPWQEPWVVESGTGWNGPLGAGAANRIFSFDNQNADSAITFDSTANHPSFDGLSDWLAYDQSSFPGTFVSDLKLSCVYRRAAGDGPFKMQLTKRQDCFTAEFLPGKVRLWRHQIAQPDPLKLGPAVWSKPLEADVPELAMNRPVAIDFSNYDYRVAIRINGREVIATTDHDYQPDVPALYDEALRAHRELAHSSLSPKPVVRFVADRQSCSIEHLRLAKDIYYLNAGNHYDAFGTPTRDPWFASPENIMELGKDEYFVLGDNSQVSLDARFWGAPVDLPREGDYHVGPGRVPGRFLLGKAFFVYWPAGYRPPSLPYGIEPDFGDMRFIK